MTSVAEKEILEMNEQIEEELKANLQVRIKTEELKKLVSRVERSAAKTSVQEILKGIYIYFDKDKIVARAMNNNYGMEVILSHNEKEKNFQFLSGKPDAVVFMDKKFPSMVNALPRKETLITVKDKRVIIKSGRSEFIVNVLEGSEYPKFPEIETACSISISPEVLYSLYDKTIYSASMSESRPLLTGIHHSIQKSTFKLVSTDSHRLSQVIYDLDTELSEDISVTVPAESLKELMKHLKGTNQLKVHFMDNQTIYELDDSLMYTRLIDGNYPVTDRLIPSAFTSEIQFKVQDLKDTFKRALISNDKDAVKFKAKPSLKQVRVQTQENQNGKFTEDLIPYEASGSDIQLGLNVRYLIDALDHHPSDSVIRLQFVGQMKPFLIRTLNGDDRNLALILPVKMAHPDMQGEVIIDNFNGDYQEELDLYEDETEKFSEEK